MRTLIITVFVVFVGFPLLSQQADVHTYEETLAMFEDLFSAEEPLNLTLKFDVTAFKKTRHQDVYHEAEMTQVVSAEIQESHSVQLKPTGTFRRQNCTLPPISLKIANSGVKSDSPEEGIQMNMVLPCKNAAKYEPYVLKEYLAYKIYTILTPHSYRIRLVRITLVDTGKGNKVTEDWAFLLEPDELLIQRLNGKMIDNDALSMNMVNPEVINSLSMFQYMIGNADYSVTGRHNLKILALNSENPPGFLPVPYDFDYSGLVNADYAVPGAALGTTSIRERYYLGPCRPEMVHEETIQELAAFEEEIIGYLKGFDYLDDKQKVDVIEYLNSYFKESRESWFIDQKITPTCR